MVSCSAGPGALSVLLCRISILFWCACLLSGLSVCDCSDLKSDFLKITEFVILILQNLENAERYKETIKKIAISQLGITAINIYIYFSLFYLRMYFLYLFYAFLQTWFILLLEFCVAHFHFHSVNKYLLCHHIFFKIHTHSLYECTVFIYSYVIGSV